MQGIFKCSFFFSYAKEKEVRQYDSKVFLCVKEGAEDGITTSLFI